MRVIYTELPSSVYLVVIDADTVVIDAAWREVLAPYEARWTPETLARSLGLDLDDVPYPSPPEAQAEVVTRLPSR